MTRARFRVALLRVAGTFLRLCLRLIRARGGRPVGTRRYPRILVIRPDHLGDVLLATPALAVLRRELPAAEITCLVGPWARPVLRGNPHVDRLHSCPFPGFERRPGQPSPSLLAPYVLLVRYAVLLRRWGPYDAALLLRDDHWWGALLTYLAGIPLRLGVCRPDAAPFLSVCVDPKDLKGAGAVHRVEQNAVLAARLVEQFTTASPAVPSAVPGETIRHGATGPIPPLHAAVSAADEAAALALLAAYGLDPRVPVVALQAGAGAPLKLWDPAACAEVVAALARQMRGVAVLLGAASERPLAEQIAGFARAIAPDIRCVVLAGETSWGGLTALLDRCALVVGVDSGTLHLATARGRPTIALFGPVDPRLFGPWARGEAHENRHRVVSAALPCQPCGRLDYCALQPRGGLLPVPCLAAITPPMVRDSARDLLLPAMIER